MAHFKFIERFDIPARSFLNFISETITELGTEGYPFNVDNGEELINCTWSVKSEVLEGEDVKELILKRSIPEGSKGEVFYAKLKNQSVVDPIKHATFSVQMLYGYDEIEDTYTHEGPEVIYQCADESMPNTERTRDHSIHVFANIDNDRIVTVIQADPVVNFDDTRISAMYIGDIELFEYNKDDKKGNILLTAGCVDSEATMSELKAKDQYFGVYTSSGNNTFQMLGTKSGVRFQKHYPSFITPAPQPGSAYVDPILGDTGLRLERQGFQASKHTGRYHLSPVYVVHPYEGYRGWLKDCIGVLNHNILHYDKLILDVDKCQYPDKPWNQEVYRFFAINTDQNFFNMSPNRDTALAILSELRY